MRSSSPRLLADSSQGELRFEERVGEHYSRLAEWMLDQSWYKDQQVAKAIMSFIDFKPSHVLELCCGAGSVLELVATRYSSARVLGVDISKKMVELAKFRVSKLSNVEVVNGDWIYDLSPRHLKQNFDLVIVKNALHLLEDVPQKLRALRSVISQKTVFVVIETVSPTQVANRFVYDLFRHVDRNELKMEFFTKGSLENVISRGGWVSDCKGPIFIYQDLEVDEWLRKKCTQRPLLDAARRLLRHASEIEPLNRAMHFDTGPGDVPSRMLRLQHVGRYRPADWLTRHNGAAKSHQLGLKLIEAQI